MTVEVTVKAEALIASLKGFRSKFKAKLLKTLDQLTIEIQRDVKENRLSGQVLHVHTGTLRRSINRRVEDKGGTLTGIVGTNVRYAAAHEYGFTGTVKVKEHLRRQKEHTKKIKFKPGKKILMESSKNTGFSTIVKAHTRTVKLPERSFLRAALKEYEGTIRDRLATAAVEALIV